MLGLVARHGWNATAFQTLEAGYRYFFHGSDACVAYIDTGAAPIKPETVTNEELASRTRRRRLF